MFILPLLDCRTINNFIIPKLVGLLYRFLGKIVRKKISYLLHLLIRLYMFHQTNVFHLLGWRCCSFHILSIFWEQRYRLFTIPPNNSQ